MISTYQSFVFKDRPIQTLVGSRILIDVNCFIFFYTEFNHYIIILLCWREFLQHPGQLVKLKIDSFHHQHSENFHFHQDGQQMGLAPEDLRTLLVGITCKQQISGILFPLGRSTSSTTLTIAVQADTNFHLQAHNHDTLVNQFPYTTVIYGNTSSISKFHLQGTLHYICQPN